MSLGRRCDLGWDSSVRQRTTRGGEPSAENTPCTWRRVNALDVRREHGEHTIIRCSPRFVQLVHLVAFLLLETAAQDSGSSLLLGKLTRVGLVSFAAGSLDTTCYSSVPSFSIPPRFPPPSTSASPGLGSLTQMSILVITPGSGMLLLQDASLPSALGRGMPRDSLVEVFFPWEPGILTPQIQDSFGGLFIQLLPSVAWVIFFGLPEHESGFLFGER